MQGWQSKAVPGSPRVRRSGGEMAKKVGTVAEAKRTEIEVFVASTLASIFEAVHSANYTDMTGGGLYVLVGGGLTGQSYPIGNKFEFKMPDSVTFDIAVTATENTKVNGGIDLKVAKLGSDLEDVRASVSRVQFAIPIIDRRSK